MYELNHINSLQAKLKGYNPRLNFFPTKDYEEITDKEFIKYVCDTAWDYIDHKQPFSDKSLQILNCSCWIRSGFEETRCVGVFSTEDSCCKRKFYKFGDWKTYNLKVKEQFKEGCSI